MFRLEFTDYFQAKNDQFVFNSKMQFTDAHCYKLFYMTQFVDEFYALKANVHKEKTKFKRYLWYIILQLW